MARAERNWDRLVRAALRGDRLVGGAYGHPVTGIAGIVPSSLGNNVHIEEVLRPRTRSRMRTPPSPEFFASMHMLWPRIWIQTAKGEVCCSSKRV
jgi:callose synthase